MKKLLLLLLLVIVLSSFVSCQKVAEPMEEPTKPPKTIYVPPNGIETREEP